MAKKILSVFMALIAVASCFSSTTVFGQTIDDDYGVQPLMEVISSCNGSLRKSGLTLYAYGTMKSSRSTNLKIQLQIQKKKSGTYSPYITWSTSKTGTTASLSKDIDVNILYTYRLKATFKAENEESVRFYYY